LSPSASGCRWPRSPLAAWRASLAEQGFTKEIIPPFFSVKEAVFPFNKFPGVDPILGPEMKSTGEVMGVGDTFGEAFAKAQLGANEEMPTSGTLHQRAR
jgi:carbamoyl-phosphate synthase large subunit